MSGPRDFAGFIFLRSAADQVGQRLFGAEWTGEEFDAALTWRILGGPREREEHARTLLAKHRPERVLPPRPRRPEPIGPLGASRSPPQQIANSGPTGLSREDLEAADEIAAQINERAEPAIRRRTALFERLVRDAEAGVLVVMLFNERDGQFRDMPAAWWRSRFAIEWLQHFQMDRRRPFDQPSASFPDFLRSGFSWLYLQRDALAGYIASIPAAEIPAWWRRPREPVKTWLGRLEVCDELNRRLAGPADPSERLKAQRLAAMADECGRPVKWQSIETIRLEQRKR